ncbi:hypothetical protein V8E53_001384 [Lactarius tabidus]
MLISSPTFLSYLLILEALAARADFSGPACTDSSMTWSFNSLQQNPCLVGAYLEAVCYDTTDFHFIPLRPDQGYLGPQSDQAGDLCLCNSVIYSLVSACAACQGAQWFSYNYWVTNCTNVAYPGVFPEPIPKGTRVPKWAYLDSFVDSPTGNSWNLAAAEAVGDSPEVTGTLILPTTSRPGPSQTPTTDGSSNHGRIVGGALGGVLGAAMISGVMAYFIVRRRRAPGVPSTTDTRGEGEMGQPVPDLRTIETPRLYHPSDSTTYPRTEFLPQRLSSTSPMQLSQPEYHGLPEFACSPLCSSIVLFCYFLPTFDGLSIRLRNSGAGNGYNRTSLIMTSVMHKDGQYVG